MSKLNIALVGAGRRGGGAHLPVIAKLKDTYNLVAICDIDQAVARQYAEQYGANPYTNVRIWWHMKNWMSWTSPCPESLIMQSLVLWQMPA